MKFQPPFQNFWEKTNHTINVATPERVMRALYTVPAPEPRDRNAIQANRFEKSRATQGTPALLTLPKIFGAFPLRAMKSNVRELTYRLELPALITATMMIALITLAAAPTPASSSAIVRGDAAVLLPFANSLGSS